MAELRKDYLLDRFVIIATERHKRPHQFKADKPSRGDLDFFAPGNEHLTPPEIYRVQDSKGRWKVRVFPNKYAFVSPMFEGAKVDPRTDNTFFTYADAIGAHEVVVETPLRSKQLWDLSDEEAFVVFDTFAQRVAALRQDPAVKYVSVFKNSGRDAGTSIHHSHSQIVAYNLVPRSILALEEACRLFPYDPYTRIIDVERTSPRHIRSSAQTISFAPYASRFELEAWVFPFRDVRCLTDLNAEELMDMTRHIMALLRSLQAITVPYNMVLVSGTDKVRFHVQILPRSAIWAGFEMGTETFVNAVTPEDAASFYRGENVK
ncbi:MAG: DUF4921 family protein [Nanoarchaeota archaeon]